MTESACLLNVEPGQARFGTGESALLKQKATDNDTVHHTDFHRPLCGHGHFGPCLRHGRQAQAHLPGHLFHRGGRGRHRGAVHQDRGILGPSCGWRTPCRSIRPTSTATTSSQACSPPSHRRWAKAMRYTSRTCSCASSSRM